MRTKDEQDLLKACRFSQFDEIEALLKKDISPQFTISGYPNDWNEIDNYKTPIGEIMHNLYSPKHLDTIKDFLDAGVDVNTFTHHTVNRTHSTPLGKALTAQEHGSKPEIQQQVVDFLLSRGADVMLLSEEDLAKIMSKGNPRLLETLLNARLDPSAISEGKTLLEHVISACTGDWGVKKGEMAKLLIKRGANLSVKDTDNKSLIQRAERPDIVTLLLQKDHSLLSTMTLFDSAILESPQFIQRLIDRGDSINAINEDGNTPLMHACKMGKAKAAFVLMQAGANINCQNKEGETALHLAMAHAHNMGHSCDYTGDRRFQILLELYSRGAIPQLDKRGRTPLMRCHVASEDYTTIRFCIEEFSEFEAHYYCYNTAEYAKAMTQAYKSQMGLFEAFMYLSRLLYPIQYLVEN